MLHRPRSCFCPCRRRGRRRCLRPFAHAVFATSAVAAAAFTSARSPATLAAVPADQPTARVDTRASASVAVPAASQLKTSCSYFDIATSLQGCSDEIALTFMASVTSHSFVISTFQGTL